MKWFARIENNKVVEMFDLHVHHPALDSLEGVFPPSMNWMLAPDGCVEGWVVHAGDLVPPTHYQVLREAEYPPYTMYLDGVVKSSSADPVEKAAGEAQIANYLTLCLAVKAKYPKPT